MYKIDSKTIASFHDVNVLREVILIAATTVCFFLPDFDHT